MIYRPFQSMYRDFKSCMDNDPAARGFWGGLEVILTYAGFHALIFHRIAHFLHVKIKLPFFPRAISQFSRFLTGIEIHPGAQIARGVFIDHGMGVVIGETAIVGEGCVIFQGVTLGGTGKETGKRHPTLGANVLVSAGAKVLGNILIGDNSRIGAQSVVLKNVPPNCTVVGVPGVVVVKEGQKLTKRGMDLDHIHLPDPIMERLEALHNEIESVHREVHDYHHQPTATVKEEGENGNQ
ncbi:serine O-acetyltransferase [bacterium]|nr:serine O-acetyltransferase [bacterium]